MESPIRGEQGLPGLEEPHRAPSFTVPDKVRVRDGKLAVPKEGWLPLRRRDGNPCPAGVPVMAMVRREGKRWHATINGKVVEPPRERNGHAIGVDRSVGQIADSDGGIHRMPDLQRLETKLERHRRAMSRKRRGSNRRKHARRKVTRAAQRLANARKAWLHRTSRKLAERAGTVVIETLNTRGMTRPARGPGTRPVGTSGPRLV